MGEPRLQWKIDHCYISFLCSLIVALILPSPIHVSPFGAEAAKPGSLNKDDLSSMADSVVKQHVASTTGGSRAPLP